ncbi:MAG TPA: hypothetical protein VJA16_16120 [Thermoanaerobaculia bacterium]
MEEERLIHLLRGLPREMAPGGFTTQVLRRLDGQPAQPFQAARRAMPADDSSLRRPAPQRWHRLMVATATVAALGVSVGVSVSVLQHDRSALPLAAGLRPIMAMANAPASGRWPAAGAAMTASPMDRTFRHEGAAGGEAGLAAVASGRQGAASPRGPAMNVLNPLRPLDAAQAHQLLREMQVERGRLERELHSLHRPGVLYLGGNESFDLVLSTGRSRAQSPPTGDRDDGENYDYL